MRYTDPQHRSLNSLILKNILLILAGLSVLPPWRVQEQGADRLGVRLTEGTNIAIALSPDRRELVFDLQGTLWKMPVTGGKATAITDALGDIRQPAWSPDGKKIAFQSYRDGNWHLWTVAPDGSNLAALTSGPFDDREPHWSPDGKIIAFSSDRSGNLDLWALELESGRMEQLTRDPASDYQPAWSPDGKRIAFVSERSAGRGIWLLQYDPDAGKRREILCSPAITAGGPSWSPSGTWLLYQTSDSRPSEHTTGKTELWLKAPAEGEPRLVSAAGEDIFPFRAGWLSDSEFLYTADGRIKRGRIESGGEQATAIAFEATITLDRPSYARKKYDFDSLAPRKVLGIVAPVVSPDGRRVTFTALGDLWIAERGKKPERITNDSFVQAHPRWSPDGTKLIYISDKQGEMDIWQRDLKTGQERMLVKTAEGPSGPVMSPDGKLIAYSVGTALTSRLRVFDLASSQTREFIDRQIQPTQISWLPDSRSVAVPMLQPYNTRYREGIYKLAILPVDASLSGGGPRGAPVAPVAPVPDRTLSYGILSPDGKKLAFVEGGRLSVAALNERLEIAGPPRRLTSELADSPSWTGDSRSLVYQSLDRLKKFDLDTGRSEEFELQLEWQPEKVEGTLVVHAGRLFDGRSPEYQREVDIVIEGNRIKEVRAHDQSLHIGKVVIDAGNKAVIPGLFEMHSHESIAVGERLGRIWLAYGITSVREPGCYPYDGAERREAWASGQRPGPRDFFAGNLLDGSRVYYPIAEGVATDEHLDLVLERARVLDYDLIKTYVRFPDGMQKKVADAAHRMGIPASSHEIWPAAGYDMDAVEHNGATSRRGSSPKSSALGRSYDDVIEIIARSGMNQTPTLILYGISYQLARHPELLENRQLLALSDEQLRGTLRERAAQGRSEALAGIIAAQGKTTLAILKAGGRITPGTDSPIVPYGFSLQVELQLLALAGLTPYEVLRSATLWSAEAVGVGSDLGTIERGKLADLVVVTGDPLHQIEDTMNVEVTIKNGRPYAIQDLLTGVR